MASNEYKDVGFVTSKSDSISYILKDTGNLIIMDDPDGTIPDYHIQRELEGIDAHQLTGSSYIYFRGKMIAGGVGSPSFIEASKVSYVANTYQAVYEDLDERMRATYAYVEYTYSSIFAYTSYVSTYLNERMDNAVGDVDKIVYYINESVAYWRDIFNK